ncbi:MAG: hypothetical protein LUC88_03650 [Prevotella sp.]|nr:hypothetical protein [Prevotella sp.]
MTKTKLEQQLEMIESLVADVRQAYGISKDSTEQPTQDEYGHKIGKDGIYEHQDREFKDIVKLRKQNHINLYGN